MISRGEIRQRIPEIHANNPLIHRFVPLLLLLRKLILVIGDWLTCSEPQYNIILIITLPERSLLDKGMLRVLLLEL